MYMYVHMYIGTYIISEGSECPSQIFWEIFWDKKFVAKKIAIICRVGRLPRRQGQFSEGLSRRPSSGFPGAQRVQGQGPEGPALIMADQGTGGLQVAHADLMEALEVMDEDASAPGVGTAGPSSEVVNTVKPEVLAQLRKFPLMDELR